MRRSLHSEPSPRATSTAKTTHSRLAARRLRTRVRSTASLSTSLPSRVSSSRRSQGSLPTRCSQQAGASALWTGSFPAEWARTSRPSSRQSRISKRKSRASAAGAEWLRLWGCWTPRSPGPATLAAATTSRCRRAPTGAPTRTYSEACLRWSRCEGDRASSQAVG